MILRNYKPIILVSWLLFCLFAMGGESGGVDSASASQSGAEPSVDKRTHAMQAAQCIVPPSQYEVSFGEANKLDGKTAWSCSTQSVQWINRTGEPIFIYFRILVQNLNENGVKWTTGISLEPDQMLDTNDVFSSGRGGAVNSQVEYNLPVDMVAMYMNDECRVHFTAPWEPPAFAAAQSVALLHPCPGPDGAGGLTTGGLPIPAPTIETDKQPPEPNNAASAANETDDQLPLNNEQQLVELVLLYERGQLEEWAGWADLTDSQRRALTAILDRVQVWAIDVRDFYDELELVYLENYEYSADTEADYQKDQAAQARAQRMQMDLEAAAAERYQAIDRIEMLLNRQRLRGYGDWVVWVYDRYRDTGLVKGSIDRIKLWFGALGDPEETARGQVEEFLSSHTGTSYDDALQQILQQTIRLANNPGVVHYGYYAQQFNTYRAQGQDADTAHASAMQDLRAMLLNPKDDFLQADQARTGHYWNLDTFKNEVKEDGLYDVVFRQLNGQYEPGVTK